MVISNLFVSGNLRTQFPGLDFHPFNNYKKMYWSHRSPWCYHRSKIFMQIGSGWRDGARPVLNRGGPWLSPIEPRALAQRSHAIDWWSGTVSVKSHVHCWGRFQISPGSWHCSAFQPRAWSVSAQTCPCAPKYLRDLIPWEAAGRHLALGTPVAPRDV